MRPNRSRWKLTVAAAAVSLVVAAGAANALVTLLPGLRLVLKDTTGRQKVMLVLQGSSIVPPLPGGADDPTLVGGSLEIINPISGENVVFDMPASNWTVNFSRTYRFYNRDAPAPPSEVKLAVLKNGRIKVRAGCRPCAPPRVFEAAGMTLDEPSQQEIGIVLNVGGRKFCALFDNPLQDAPGRFIARNSLAPSSCPGVGPTTTTTTTTITTTTSTSTSTTTPSSPSLAFID